MRQLVLVGITALAACGPAPTSSAPPAQNYVWNVSCSYACGGGCGSAETMHVCTSDKTTALVEGPIHCESNFRTTCETTPGCGPWGGCTCNAAVETATECTPQLHVVTTEPVFPLGPSAPSGCSR